MVMSYEQWQIILGIIDQKVNLSKDNVIEKIKNALKRPEILESPEISRMLEEVSHTLEISTEIPRVRETQEPLKKRIKVLNVPKTLEESKKILKEQKAQEVLKRLGVREVSGKSKAVALEDVLNAKKISEKVPVIIDTKNILETLKGLRKASEDIYRKWEKAEFDVNYWFAVNYNISSEHDQHTLLNLAISFRLKNVVDALLELKEVDINVSSPFSQWTALHWAVENGDEEAVLKLIERGANVNAMDSSRRNPLYHAAVNGHIKIMDLLIKNKADVNVKDIVETTALYKAVNSGHKEAVELLMDNGAEVKRNGILNLTPLHVAVINNYKEILKYLIEKDKNIRGNINVVNKFGWTPLYCAVVANNISILRILLQNNAGIDLEDKNGLTPLHIAAIKRNSEAIELLLNHNEVKLKAIKKEISKILSQDDAGINLQKKFSDLNLYITNETPETLEELLEHKKKYVNMRDVWGYTAFDYSIIQRDIKAVRTLIKYKASTDTKDPFKILAIFQYNTSVMYLPVEHLEVNYHELIKAHDLLCAARRNDMYMIYTLLSSGVNINASDDLKLTALHEAAKSGHPEVTEILILCGAAVDARDNLETTPLNYAVKYHHWEVVEILRSYGADPSLQDKCSETVISLAKRKNTSKILDAVEKIIQANRTARTQLEPSIELCGGRVTPLANKIVDIQLGSSPNTKMDGVEEQKVLDTIKEKELSTVSSSDSSRDGCEDRWSCGIR